MWSLTVSLVFIHFWSGISLRESAEVCRRVLSSLLNLVPILFPASCTMENRHVGLTLDDLHEEQRSIDLIINSLLEFTPPSTSSGNNISEQAKKKSVSGSFSNNLRVSSPHIEKKGRGRPPKVNLPPSSPTPALPNQGPSLDVIVECLNKLNSQNKKLLSFVETLSRKTPVVDNSDQLSPQQNEVTSANQNQVLSGVNDRLEKIEQNLNSNILICRGNTVESLITDATSETSLNLDRLKGKVCESICGTDATSVDISSMQVSLIGRNKKLVKINCGNSYSRDFLLKQARRKKPHELFVSEFLTPSKLNIFYNLRQLKKQHPEKFKSIFTRGGNIFYRLQNSDRTLQVASLDDLSKILLTESSSNPNSSD